MCAYVHMSVDDADDRFSYLYVEPGGKREERYVRLAENGCSQKIKI